MKNCFNQKSKVVFKFLTKKTFFFLTLFFSLFIKVMDCMKMWIRCYIFQPDTRERIKLTKNLFKNHQHLLCVTDIIKTIKFLHELNFSYFGNINIDNIYKYVKNDHSQCFSNFSNFFFICSENEI